MLTVTENDFNKAYPAVIRRVLSEGVLLPSRVAPAKEVHPAAIAVRNPLQRLVTAYGRPVNVAFALAEVLWILQGRDDVEMLSHYNGTIANYSDNGETFNAAYGARLRHSFETDQLLQVERILREDPESRQASLVLSHPEYDRGYDLWDASGPKNDTKDRACNVYAHLMIRDGALDWLQVVRSNDALWGIPYNWMQFSHIQEFIATRLGVPVGKYTHVVDSLHIYDYHLAEAHNIEPFNLYDVLRHEHAPMEAADDETMAKVFKAEQEARTGVPETVLDLPEYWHGVITLLHAHAAYKEHRDQDCLDIILNADPVYAAAQIRFMYHHRWHRSEHSEMVDSLKDTLDPVIFEWVTSSTAS